MKYLSRILFLIAIITVQVESLSAQRRVSRGSRSSQISLRQHTSHQQHRARLRRPQLRVPVCRVPVRRAPVTCNGHRVARQERVWVAGAQHRVWHPARYGWRIDRCGLRLRYKICAGHYETVEDPGSWQIVTKYVWVRRPCCG